MVILSVGRQVRPGTPKLQRKRVIVLQGFVLCLVKAPDSLRPQTVAHQAPLSWGFFRQEYLNGLPFSPPGDLPDPGVKSMSPVSPALQADSLPVESLGSMSKAEKKDISFDSAIPHLEFYTLEQTDMKI